MHRRVWRHERNPPTRMDIYCATDEQKAVWRREAAAAYKKWRNFDSVRDMDEEDGDSDLEEGVAERPTERPTMMPVSKEAEDATRVTERRAMLGGSGSAQPAPKAKAMPSRTRPRSRSATRSRRSEGDRKDKKDEKDKKPKPKPPSCPPSVEHYEALYGPRGAANRPAERRTNTAVAVEKDDEDKRVEKDDEDKKVEKDEKDEKPKLEPKPPSCPPPLRLRLTLNPRTCKVIDWHRIALRAQQGK